MRGEAYIVFVGNSDEKDLLGDAGIDVRIILKWIFMKWNLGEWTGKRLLMIGTVRGHLFFAAMNIRAP